MPQLMLQTGHAIELNPKKRPAAFLSDRTRLTWRASKTERSFVRPKDEADRPITGRSSQNAKLTELFTASGADHVCDSLLDGTDWVPISKVGVEISDSPMSSQYAIMARVGVEVLSPGTDGEFVKGSPIGAPLIPTNRIPPGPESEPQIHLPLPGNAGNHVLRFRYGGNALLGKKCHARIASVQARDEGWLAEHMLILKLTSPQGEVKYVTGPSVSVR